MLAYDKNVPGSLRTLQDWFASIITRPIDDQSRINPVAPNGESIETEAGRFIRPSSTLQAEERIEIYNQQYWWRLLNVLHETFPLTVRLFGYYDFNQKIAIPYLEAYPPNHWSLNTLGDTLSEWAEKNYNAADRELILNAVAIDWAYQASFYAAHYQSVNLVEASQKNDVLLETPLHLQPHVHLFSLNNNLFAFREALLKKDVDEWLNLDFPQLQKERRYHIILYRHPNYDLHWQELSEAAYEVLKRFEKAESIESLCHWLERQDEALVIEASEHLHHWFQQWAALQWIGLPSSEE